VRLELEWFAPSPIQSEVDWKALPEQLCGLSVQGLKAVEVQNLESAERRRVAALLLEGASFGTTTSVEYG